MSKQPAYTPSLERSKSGSHQQQPNGVSEADKEKNRGWGHRTQIEVVDSKKRKSISRRVNERRDGEQAGFGKPDHGRYGGDASNENDDALVDSGKSIKQKYADKYGSENE